MEDRKKCMQSLVYFQDICPMMIFFWQKCKTDPLTFTFFSFQSSNFQFCQFSSLTFNFCQFGTTLNFSYLLPLDPLKRPCFAFLFLFFFFFFNLELKENKKNLEKKIIRGTTIGDGCTP